MTAACAAIWLADMPALDAEAAAAAAAAAEAEREDGPPWCVMPICDDRFDVLMDGSVGSKEPCVAECFRECPLTSVAGDPWVTARVPAGREKL